jgi:hypothetical protein
LSFSSYCPLKKIFISTGTPCVRRCLFAPSLRSGANQNTFYLYSVLWKTNAELNCIYTAFAPQQSRKIYVRRLQYRPDPARIATGLTAIPIELNQPICLELVEKTQVVLEEQADVGDDCVSLTFDTRTGTIPTDFSPLCPCDMFRGCFFPLQGLLVLISAGLIGA